MRGCGSGVFVQAARLRPHRPAPPPPPGRPHLKMPLRPRVSSGACCSSPEYSTDAMAVAGSFGDAWAGRRQCREGPSCVDRDRRPPQRYTISCRWWRAPITAPQELQGAKTGSSADTTFLRAQNALQLFLALPHPSCTLSPSQRSSRPHSLLPSPASHLQQKQQHGAASLPRWRGGGVLNLRLAACGGAMLRRSGC